VAQTVRCLPVTSEDWIHTQASPYGTRIENVALGQDFSPSTSVFPCRYLPTSAPYCSSSYCSYEKDKRSKTRDPTNIFLHMSRRMERKVETSYRYGRTKKICVLTRQKFFEFSYREAQGYKRPTDLVLRYCGGLHRTGFQTH
jgi:hypothetical protein